MEDDNFSGPEADTKVAVPHPTSRPPQTREPMEAVKNKVVWLDDWREPLMFDDDNA
jgi:hypothetical protein